MITLVTPTQGNPKALRRTMDNVKSAFGGLVNEVMVGDVSVFHDNFTTGFEDARIIKMPFDTLFKHGFSRVLNELAEKGTNNLCMYLNVGEIVESNLNTSLLAQGFNCYSFNHATDPHTWFRVWDKRELQWSGRIHEEITGRQRRCPRHLFTMADTPKDDDSDWRAGIYNDIKEMVYFQQYVHIAEHPEDLGATNRGWLDYSVSGLDDFKRRLAEKGERYTAMLNGDLAAYLAAAERDNPSKEWSKP